ncbi:MAG: DUF2764 family protein [Bacteroidales bacterium]|jgi:hypothetical protein
MGNYHYIITGLPDLVFDVEGKAFSYDETRNSLYELCSAKDQKLIDTLELGFDEANLNASFYNDVALSKSRFLREYFAFDREFRNLKVSQLAIQQSIDPEEYLVGEIDRFFEEKDKITAILNEKNILDRERSIDKLIWDKVNDITAFNFFDIEKILAFLVKARITARWCAMDKEKGSEFFKELVDEVRGTFQGVDTF